MKAHINARTTYKSRVLILERHHEGWSKTKIARAYQLLVRSLLYPAVFLRQIAFALEHKLSFFMRIARAIKEFTRAFCI